MPLRARYALLLVAAVASWAQAEESWRDRISLTLSERVRGEITDWFEPKPIPPADVKDGVDPKPVAAPPGAERYQFFASQLRVGARVILPHAELVLQAQDTRLAGLPDDANLPAPAGNLGPGAIYFANTHDTSQGEPFLKLGFLTLRQGGSTATLGRFEYREGLETVPADPALATLKRTRIAERLVGPFDFTHVTRSFDGGRLAFDRGRLNVTAVAARPTHGGFEVSANREIEHMGLAGLAATFVPPGAPADVRAFYLFYDDDRQSPTRVDNRSLKRRVADHSAINVHTFGGHAATVLDLGPGRLDLLGWTALQAGAWGTQDHVAWAWAAEGGYQLPAWPTAPWIRIGYDRSSGDDDPADSRHETFFQVLPTARIYAQLPFYNLMNSEDLFTSLLLRPHARVILRTDWHWLRVTEPHDLWYSGGGATNDDLFGFAGSPTGNHRALAYLADVSASVTVRPDLLLGLYYGHAFGQDAVGAAFQGTNADYGFIELTYRYGG